MRLGIRLKFSVFLAALLLMTVFVLGVLLMTGIEAYQKSQFEAALLREADTAQLYTSQSYLSYSQMTPDVYLAFHGQRLALNLSRMFQQPAAVYDGTGVLLGSSAEGYTDIDMKPLIETALDRKSAYMIVGSTVFFASPLIIGNAQYGVVLLLYSLEQNRAFNSNMTALFIKAGVLAVLVGFVAGYTCFYRFSKSIRRLTGVAESIKSGSYEVPAIKRRDELGQLSDSLGLMSGQIKSTIGDLRAEREKLSLAVDKLSRLERQQKQFIGNVTHEFKTPLTAAGAYLDLLDMYPEDSALREEAYRNIRLNIDKLRDLVDKVLYLSALEKYEFEMHPQKTDVKACLQKACACLRGKAGRFGVVIETALEEAAVWADEESLSEIFVNLIDNAIKYNVENGRVTVRCAPKGDKIHITVADTGIGIPEEIREKIFEPFFMADKARSRQSGGTGLGLALVRQLVSKLGGEISLVGEPGQSTVFLLVFPVMQ